MQVMAGAALGALSPTSNLAAFPCSTLAWRIKERRDDCDTDHIRPP